MENQYNFEQRVGIRQECPMNSHVQYNSTIYIIDLEEKNKKRTNRENEGWMKEILKKYEEKNERRKRTKIERLKYINIYKDIMTEELSIYLRGKKKRT